MTVVLNVCRNDQCLRISDINRINNRANSIFISSGSNSLQNRRYYLGQKFLEIRQNDADQTQNDDI